MLEWCCPSQGTARKWSSGSSLSLLLHCSAGMWEVDLISPCFVQFLNVKVSCKDGNTALGLDFPVLFLVLCCIFSWLVTVMRIGKHRRKEGSPPCLWKEVSSILCSQHCVLGSLGGTLALPEAEGSKPRAVPQSRAVLHCPGSIWGWKPLSIWESFVTLWGLNLSKPTCLIKGLWKAEIGRCKNECGQVEDVVSRQDTEFWPGWKGGGRKGLGAFPC